MSIIPELTIAIITYNRVEVLGQTLRAIRDALVGLSATAVEVVVCDNASEDETCEMVCRFTGLEICYFRNEVNVGGAENVLLACERANGKFVLLHADDDLLLPNALKVLLDIFAQYPEVGIVSSSLQAFPANSPESPLTALRFPSTKNQLYLRRGGEAFEKLFLRACSLSGLVIRRDLLDLAGARASITSQYPQMHLVGAAAKRADAIYLAEPLMKLRLEEVRRWSYAKDFMSEAIFSILRDLVGGEEWGQQVKEQIIKKRIVAAYGPLYSAKKISWKTFYNTVRGFSAVKEYRSSYMFWGMVTGIALFGCAGVGLIRRLWSGPPGADAIA